MRVPRRFWIGEADFLCKRARQLLSLAAHSRQRAAGTAKLKNRRRSKTIIQTLAAPLNRSPPSSHLKPEGDWRRSLHQGSAEHHAVLVLFRDPSQSFLQSKEIVRENNLRSLKHQRHGGVGHCLAGFVTDHRTPRRAI